MRPRLLLFAVVLAASSAHAQEAEFEPGYLVVDGDSVWGEVALGTEVENGSGTRFRVDGAVTPIGPGDADAFGATGGRAYRDGLFRVRAVPDPAADTPDVRAGYARVVRDGAADLLALEFIAGRPHFFVEVGEGPRLGLYADRRGGADGSVAYRRTLSAALVGCTAGAPDWSRLRYRELELAAAVDAYNACVDPSYAPRRAGAARRRAAFEVEGSLGVLAGRFAREVPVTFDPTYRDPGVAAVRLAVAARVRPTLAPEAVALRIGLEYVHQAMKVNLFGEAGPVRQVNLLHLDLGASAGAPVGGATVEAGAGVLVGTVLLRDLGDDPDPRARDDLFLYFRGGRFAGRGARDLGGSGGVYARLGVRPRAVPVGLDVRVQRTEFVTERVLLPFFQSAFYSVTSGAVALTVDL